MHDLQLVLIARDESRSIARCLDSARPWVDRMLVLDTGSADDTPAIARAHGAIVHHLPWPDDFAAARNHALSIDEACWSLVLDADEWIESGGELLRPWVQGPPRLGVVCIHSSYDGASASTAGAPVMTNRAWTTRLLPRGTRYRGRVHEQVTSPLPRERLGLQVGHDGYRDARRPAKRGRNRRLLELDLQDHPGDPYILYQLGKDAEVDGDYERACHCYEGVSLHGTAGWHHEFVVRHLYCLGRVGRGAEALARAEAGMARWSESPDFFFTLGNLLLDQAVADPERAAAHWLPLAGDAWRRCLEIGERPDLEGSVHGRGSHLARHNLEVIGAR